MARSAGAGLALCLGALCANAAVAQTQQRPATSGGRLGDMLFDRDNGRNPAHPPVARYVAGDSVAFILDRSGPQPLIRFDGSQETWALYAQSAPRGDIIYKNDMGEPVLRVSRLGGLTVFTATRPEGAAAALRSGAAPSLQLQLMRAVVGLKRIKAASDRVSSAAGRQIGIEGPDIGDTGVAVAVDAANVVAETFMRLARSDRNKSALQRITQVVLLEGDKASVELNRGALVVTIVPGRGVAGRPSSAKIARVLRR